MLSVPPHFFFSFYIPSSLVCFFRIVLNRKTTTNSLQEMNNAKQEKIITWTFIGINVTCAIIVVAMIGAYFHTESKAAAHGVGFNFIGALTAFYLVGLASQLVQHFLFAFKPQYAGKSSYDQISKIQGGHRA